jgi:hypothetical protein
LPFTDLDKIFWLRAGLGVVGGTLSELLFGCKVIASGTNAGTCAGGAVPDYSFGILLALFLFMASYYVLKGTIGKKFPKEQQGKIYTTGVGSFALLFIFTWVMLFTLGVTFLNL